MKRKLPFAALLLGIAAVVGWILWSGARDGARVPESTAGARAELPGAQLAQGVEPVAPDIAERQPPAPLAVDAAPAVSAPEPALLRVRVLAEESRAPLPGVRVELRRVGGKPPIAPWDENTRRVLANETLATDASGWVEFVCASGFDFELLSGGQEVERVGRWVDSLAPGERREIQLLSRTQDDVTVFGVVQDGETMRPVRGVELRSRDQDSALLARSDAEGRFELRGASWKQTLVRATAPGWAETWFPISDDRTDAANPLRVLLWRGGILDVRVTDAGGEPVAGAAVLVSTRAYFFTPEQAGDGAYGGGPAGRSATTDAEGKATLADLQPRTALEVSTRAPGAEQRVEAEAVTLAPGERRALEIRSGAGATLRGQVLGEGEQPLADREVWRVVSVVQAPLPVLLEKYVNPAESVSTDSAGRFEFRDVSMGMWSVGVAPDVRRGAFTYSPEGRAMRDTAGLEPGEASVAETILVRRAGEVFDVTLRVLPGLTVRGRVLDPNGSPRPACGVTGYHVGSAMRATTQSDRAGEFELGPLPAGTWELVAGGSGGFFAASNPVRAEAGGEPVVLQLQEGSWITGRILAGGAEVGESCEVTLVPLESGYAGRVKRSSGAQFEFSGLLAGNYVVVARDRAGGVGLTPAIRVEAGKHERERDITLQPGANLVLRYQGAQRLVEFELLAGTLRIEVGSCFPGKPLVKSVPPGSIEVLWQVGDIPRSRTVVVSAGETKDVVLDDRP